MIKNIPVDQLRPGMYIHDLNCSWINHPFARDKFRIQDQATIAKIIDAGIKEVYIDTDKGSLLDEGANKAPAIAEASTGSPDDSHASESKAAPMVEPAAQPSAFIPNIIVNLSPVQKFNRAKNVCANASQLMHDMMRDIRLGKQVELEQCAPMVDNIVDVMYSFPSAMLPLAQMKSRDEYTYQHSVSVAALAVAFGRVLNLSHQDIKDLSMGGLLHDVGKAKVPSKILNKPGKLDESEFAVMKNHASHTAELIKNIKGLSPVSFNAAAEHHERWDGSGYPGKLKGEQISLHGQMMAIVDVYDAITSIRIYHKGMPPHEALKKMYEWGGTHFNSTLVQAFIKGIGIYPAGSLVRMESDKLGIVREIVPERLLQPIVQLIYDCKNKCMIRPETVDLSASNDKIKSHESFEAWGIDQARWATTSA